MKLTENQIKKYANAKELKIEMPKTITNRILKKYHLNMGLAEEDIEGDLFYNDDLRSICGYCDDDRIMYLDPYYYAKMFPEYFEKLLNDAVSVEITKK